MKTLRIAILAAAIGASALWTMALARRGAEQINERGDIRRHQAEELAELTAENERLSNAVDQTRAANPAFKAQLTELAKLRNEAGTLRRSAAEKARLLVANAKLRAADAEIAKELAEARANPNFWPKDRLTFAGYGDPASAVQSMLAAFKNGDSAALRDSWSPGAVTNLEAEWRQHGLTQEQMDENLTNMAGMLISASDGFHIVGQTNVSPDEAVVSLSFDGEGKTRDFRLQRVGGEWKFVDMVASGMSIPFLR